MSSVRYFGLAVIAILILFLAPITSLVPRTFGALEPIRLGEVGPLSPPGNYAEGQLMKQAVQIATDEINAKGGVLGRPIEVSYQDDRGAPEEGVAAMERLVSQYHVVGVVGGYHSSAFLAEIEVAHKYGIPVVDVDAWATKITEKGYPEIFRVSPNFALIDTLAANWMVAAGFKNIALLFEKTDSGQNSRQTIVPILDKAGIHYDSVQADLNTTDFTSQLLRFKAHHPPYDLFFAHFGGAGFYSLVRDSYKLGFAPSRTTGLFDGGEGSVDPTFWQNVSEAGKYVVGQLVGLPKGKWNDKTKLFLETFVKRFNVHPSPQAVEAYDAEWILADAIRRAKATDPRAVITALENTNWLGARGRYTFSKGHDPAWAYHQYMASPVVLIQYSQAGQTPDDAPIVWPKSFATVSYLYQHP